MDDLNPETHMTESKARPAVVVGIDGSEAAIRAARWAVRAAVGRNLPLRLIYVIEPGSEAVRLEAEYAGIALREARAAVTTSGQEVDVETGIRYGRIDAVLAQESCNAEMICVGTGDVDSDSDDLSDRPAHTTASDLTRSARCRVVVVGQLDEEPPAEPGCLAVVIDESSTAELMLQDAFREARLRNCALMVLDVGAPTLDVSLNHRISRWQASYPDVPVHCLALRTDVIAFLEQCASSISTTFVDGSDSDWAARLIATRVDGSVSQSHRHGLRHAGLAGAASLDGELTSLSGS